MEKRKILVVDDESRMRKLVRDFLVKQNFEVLEAGDGEEALDVFYKNKDCIDYSGCYDAEDERLGCMPGNQGKFQDTDYHADSQE